MMNLAAGHEAKVVASLIPVLIIISHIKKYAWFVDILGLKPQPKMSGNQCMDAKALFIMNIGLGPVCPTNVWHDCTIGIKSKYTGQDVHQYLWRQKKKKKIFHHFYMHCNLYTLIGNFFRPGFWVCFCFFAFFTIRNESRQVSSSQTVFICENCRSSVHYSPDFCEELEKELSF